MRATSSYSLIAILVVLVGFGLVLSKYSVLPVLGVVLALLGFFAPFYRDSILRLPLRFQRETGKTKKVVGVEKMIEAEKSRHAEADFSKQNLRNANFAGADLSGANLKGANLNEADLSGANLNEADLSDANLNEADLSRAKLVGANLSEADLSGAHGMH